MPGEVTIKGFVIAGTGSNCGKTTLSLGIMKYFTLLGYKVAPFKIGPDFIDPGHHAEICGTTSTNLDSWMLSQEYNQYLFMKGCKHCDLAIVEGVMGLFDGYGGISEAGSTAQMAKWLNLPVILVVDAKGMAASAAAIVKGFESFDKDLNIAGVIFNRTGSPNHYQYLEAGIIKHCKAKPLGYILRDENLYLPDRHLGLITAREQSLTHKALMSLNSMIHKNTSLKEFVFHLPGIRKFSSEIPLYRQGSHSSKKVRLAVAKDKAFCFYYPENLEILENHGAEIIYFSPLCDSSLPDNIHGIYFGGGYPEIYAETLSKNRPLLQEIKKKSLAGMPIYAECGGFMYLCSDLTGFSDNRKYPMASCFPFSVETSGKLRSLGYREITLLKKTLIGEKGAVLRGHEFHYSFLNDPVDGNGIENIYNVKKRDKNRSELSGFLTKSTLGSYFHVHFGSCPKAGKSFVNALKIYQKHNE